MTYYLPGQRIEVCGGIASGKTTLVHLLAQSGMLASYEDFRANPFWSAFYENPTLSSFETEITFFLQHYHNIKIRNDNKSGFATDFSLWLDLAYARVTLDQRKQAIFSLIHAEVIHEIGHPTLLVHLECDAETQLSRVRRRARAEEESITLEYLIDINRMLHSVLAESANDLNIVRINSSNIDFINSSDGKEFALYLISKAISHS
ncbi:MULTISPECIES: deoxynucleoside kinase [unclassified Synechococcus]|uniref:deoxynucleoside kinase n=1 Tax=unclassified Synechococcus TaxID=2626047 RepID=UPI0021A3D4C5|nr:MULTISPECIES: deoxynucleoside kinase [unclassified Synechococcus]MCT0212144.1 deoxynucleoside kinase [Synechococcus sp. CS-1326]MCT0232650.1 deoxynucleoside kinase [Synechococcus sp. CS-1327]